MNTLNILIEEEIERIEEQIENIVIRNNNIEREIEEIVNLNDDIEEIHIYRDRDCYKNIGRWLSKDLSLSEVVEYCNSRGIKGFCKNGNGKYYIKDREYDSLIEKLEDENKRDYLGVNFFVIKNVEEEIDISDRHFDLINGELVMRE